MRRFQDPRANMVIRRSGPNFPIELEVALNFHLVFLIQICSIILPIQVIGFLHPLAASIVEQHVFHAVSNAGSL